MHANRLKYPGRGIIIGESPMGDCAIAYFIMGRSANSRNRILEINADGLYTAAADESKVEDPRLIIYRAAAKLKIGATEHVIISNGDHTDTIADFIRDGKTFKDALMTRREEPDKPNYTPRISGIISFADGKFTYEMSILKRDESKPEKCRRIFFALKKERGTAHLIHTYNADSDPLPPFEGEPRLIEIPSDTESFANKIWNDLDEDNRISIFAAMINPITLESTWRIINKYKKQEAK